jgi:hypothetical protein
MMPISAVRRLATLRGLRRARTLAVGLAVVLALFQLAAAGHRHDRLDARIDASFDTHACGLCAALPDESPAPPAGLPPLVAQRGVRWYAAPTAAVAVVMHGRPPMKPAGCGPPCAVARA